MYLIDTKVISEARKKERANAGVRAFFKSTAAQGTALYLSEITVGELRCGIDLLRHRGDGPQADLLETWLTELLSQFADRILAFDQEAAQTWGRLRVPQPDHEIDKQIAATAWVHGLTVVTRNTTDFAATGVKLINPFS